MAFFLRYYSGHSLQDVFDMYAKTFFSLLNEAYKLQAEEAELSANIALLPHVEDSDRRQFFDTIKRAKRDIMDIGKANDDYSGLESLKGALK